MGFFLLCFVCLIYHVSVITISYLNYETTNNVILDTPIMLKDPALSVCWRYADVLDIARLNRDTGQNLAPIDFYNRRKTLVAIQKAVTLQQLFDYSPSKESVF